MFIIVFYEYVGELKKIFLKKIQVKEMIINNFRQENDSINIIFFPILRNLTFLINRDPEKTTTKNCQN